MAQWIRPGEAMELRAGGMVLVLEETPDGVTLDVICVAGAVLVEPRVELVEGHLVIDLSAAPVALPGGIPVPA